MSVIVRRIFVVGCLVAAGVLLIHYHDNSRLADFLAMPIGPKCNATGSDDWKVIRAGDMTPDQMFEYLKWTNSSSCQLAYDFGGHVMGPAVKKGIDGQKTVCMDQHVAPVPGSCLIYSFGINNEWSFDKHFDEFGCHVYAFDPSMNMASGDYTPRIHFSRIGLSSEKQRRRNWKLLPLDSIYSQLKEKHGSKTIDYHSMGHWRLPGD